MEHLTIRANGAAFHVARIGSGRRDQGDPARRSAFLRTGRLPRDLVA